jgi:prepilin-type N-terminal cleavage/methylation domain-containing protein
MNMRTRRQAAFTLIELLVVVAIISILASIAVPNFIEALTRARVSRAKNDMRTIANAWESYRVDWNCYPLDGDNDPTAGPWWQIGLIQVTTPVAYISSLPHDPFFTWAKSGAADVWVSPTYEVASAVLTMSPNAPAPYGAPDNGFDCYCVFSIGPNAKEEFTNNDHWPAASNCNLIPYDPTNGTVSVGDIVRLGGTYRVGSWKINGVDWRQWKLPFD